MHSNPSNNFKSMITPDDIQNYTDENIGNKGQVVKKIQNIKKNIVRNIYKDFSTDGPKIIDPSLIKGIEKEYHKLLQREDNKINREFHHEQYSQDMKDMFIPQEFSNDYIWDFNNLRNTSLIETPKWKLDARKKFLNTTYANLWPKDKEELKRLNIITKLLDSNTIKNTRSRTIHFDVQELSKAKNNFNAQCFFEQDKNWNKHYFSFNELLNDLETFGIESGYPVLDTKWLQIPGIPNAQKHIKLALVKNILEKYRDYQEILMYNFKDYEKHIQENPFSNYNNQKWILAEKVVEWSFRNFANLEDRYDIKVKKSSVGEDQKNKIDLLVEVKDKTSWVNITKELQLTLDHDPDVLNYKKQQIAREKTNRAADLDLLQLELSLLDQKMTLWKNMDRPIWWLNDLLSIEDKEFLKNTFERIIIEIQKKEEEKNAMVEENLA